MVVYLPLPVGLLRVVLQSGYAAAECHIMAYVKNYRPLPSKFAISINWAPCGLPTAAKISFKIINKWLKYVSKCHFGQNQAFRFIFAYF